MRTKNNQGKGVDFIFINGDKTLRTFFTHKGMDVTERHLDSISMASKKRLENLIQNPDCRCHPMLLKDGLNMAISRKYSWQ